MKKSLVLFVYLVSYCGRDCLYLADGEAAHPVYSNSGIVVTAEPHATEVGAAILHDGGNAFDAAVAVGFALAVTYPQAGNLGGGGFLVALTANGKRIFLDFRETAPQAATRDMFLGEEGNIIERLSTDSLLSVGVPGTVDGLLGIQEEYGRLTRHDVLAPAIRLAKEGFRVDYPLAQSLQAHQEHLTRHESTTAIFYPNGESLGYGDVLAQPDLAATLTAIQQDGANAFYRGPIADRIVDYMKKHQGLITHEDLKQYSSRYREPFVFQYKNFELITPSLPSSGGIALCQILRLIEPFDFRQPGWMSAGYIHTMVEAERLAFADRNTHLGDSDFVDSPIHQLTSVDYLNERRRAMPSILDGAGASDKVKAGSFESPETTHYCAVDRYGNVVAVTYTLNGSYGMGAVVEGAGFFLNNEMDDFSANPGQPNMYGLIQGESNAIEPGKRMLSSMTPTIALKDNRFAFTIGTPGGPTIITTVAQVFLNMAEFGMNIREAIEKPRFHHQWYPDEIQHETFCFSPETELELKRMGYRLKAVKSIGNAVGIERINEEILAGYADGRGYGSAGRDVE